ncbi:MurR/RpiR family transcriptional regulator [Paracandidimonas soli]|uniref:RpiR family transcriptional regulator n=1 Tax=Paracandidimonas soli TaxID=1917182 RepID=A0A4R3VG22_9BURK|nr:MurR/RpiR family transcriptional regulator [Paracandidimonas soli]TCV02742.1 RpiR family transcriptional regulator [Paracandidimonas soli]
MPISTNNLLQELQERLPSLSPSQGLVARVILSDPQAAAVATVEELAKKAGVSMPTIVRTCRSFGYMSVRDFMVALAQSYAASGSHLHRSVLATDSTSDVASKVIYSAISSLRELVQNMDAEIIDKVTDRMAAAERIDCYSVGASSTFIANELQSRLFRLRVPSNSIFDANQQLVSASTLGPKGIAFIISHLGRMPYTLDAARYARAHGATVIALTQPGTPLAEISDLVLAVSPPQDPLRSVGTETYLAHLVLIEILMVRLAQKLGPVAVHDLQRFKRLMHEYGFDSSAYVNAIDSRNEPDGSSQDAT